VAHLVLREFVALCLFRQKIKFNANGHRSWRCITHARADFHFAIWQPFRADISRHASSREVSRFVRSAWVEMLVPLSLDHGANLGAEVIEREGFRKHVHAWIEKTASERGVFGVS